MDVNDSVYGFARIEEPVLIDLINSKAVQRLKGISQQGLPKGYYHLDPFSRYEHSIGVLIILRRLNALLEEQMAGLLHDVSHTAFSHVIDQVFGDPLKETYQDETHLEFIKNSDIPLILKRHGFDYKQICDNGRFFLLERPAPELCADRFDYSMRELVRFESAENIKLILSNIVNYHNRIVFISEYAAKVFSEDYAKLQKEHWAGNETKARYHILSSILKIALGGGIILKEDINKTDSEVIGKLEASSNIEIRKGLDLLKGGFQIVESNSEGSFLLKKKFRYVDPSILLKNGLVKLSDISLDYKRSLAIQRQESSLGKHIEIIGR